MLFSVLIANYNNGKFFKDCYDSLIAQTYDNWEAIIVDDASTDDSINVIKSIIGNDHRFTIYINNKNYGCGYTKNKCAELAKGEICGFVDPDDAILPVALTRMVEAHKANVDSSLVHSSFYYCDELLEIKSQFELAGPTRSNEMFTNLDGRVTHFASFKLSHYQDTGGIDKTLFRAVDQDLYLKLWEKGPFLFLNYPLYKYRIHNQGIASAKGYHAFYYHLRALYAAEVRRKVSFENEVALQLEKRNVIREKEWFDLKNMENPRYLIGKSLKLFRQSPVKFLKTLIGR